jgi:hypothetical protein
MRASLSAPTGVAAAGTTKKKKKRKKDGDEEEDGRRKTSRACDVCVSVRVFAILSEKNPLLTSIRLG